LGTLSYMAPEQIEGHPRPASGQYALGVVVYEWLCCERPFEGSVSEVMVKQLSVPPPSLRERVLTIPLGIEQVVLRALAKAPRSWRRRNAQDRAIAVGDPHRLGSKRQPDPSHYRQLPHQLGGVGIEAGEALLAEKPYPLRIGGKED
jgi:serine/threonine protein kinase